MVPFHSSRKTANHGKIKIEINSKVITIVCLQLLHIENLVHLSMKYLTVYKTLCNKLYFTIPLYTIKYILICIDVKNMLLFTTTLI